MSQRIGSITQETNYKRQQWRVCVFALLILIEGWDVSHVGYVCVCIPPTVGWEHQEEFRVTKRQTILKLIELRFVPDYFNQQHLPVWVIQMLHKNTGLTQYTSIQIDKWPTQGFQWPLQFSVRRKFPFPVEKCSNAIPCSLYTTLCYIDCCTAWQLRPIKARRKNSKRSMPWKYKLGRGFGFWKKINFTYSKVRPNVMSFT